MTRPNIVFLVWDAVRVDHVSTYDYERETTPRLTELAADGVRYDNAFAPSIWTPSVHGAIFTGKYPSHSGIYGNSLAIPDDLETLPEQLKRAGYRTFAASAGAHIRADRGYDRGIDDYVETRRIGLDADFVGKVLRDRSFAKQVGFTLTRGPDDKTRYKYDRLQRFAADAIDDDQPFFGFINAKTPHHPYNPPRPYKGKFIPDFDRPGFELLERALGKLGRRTQRLPGHDMEKLRGVSKNGGDGALAGAVELTDEEWAVIEAWYDGAIRYLDSVLGEFVEFLQRQGAYENTMLVVTADHGDNFGDYGLTNHIFALYDTLTHVPLVIKPPQTGGSSADSEGTAAGSSTGQTPSRGLRIDNQVSLIDLHPTFLEAAGEPLPDYDLTESLYDFDDRRYHDYTFAEYAGYDGPVERLSRKYPDFDATQYAKTLQSVRDDEYKLIVDSGGTRELYAWREDPREQTDLAGDHPDVVERLGAVIEAYLGELERPGEFETPDDPELEAQLEDLGYL